MDDKDPLSYMFNTVVADDLSKQEAGTLAGMVLPYTCSRIFHPKNHKVW